MTICDWFKHIWKLSKREEDFGKPEKEVTKTIPHEAALGTYRIVPHGENKFLVERYDLSEHYYPYGEPRVPSWNTVQEWMPGPFPTRNRDIILNSEEEAERYVFNKFEEKRLAEEERIRKEKAEEEHRKMYPPREVPPYKFNHEVKNETL